MKRRISIGLALGVLLSLASLTVTAQKDAATRKGVMSDTGIVTPGPGQVLRITINWGDGGASAVVHFRRIEYAKDPCTEVCRLTVFSQTTSAPMTLAAGEGASFDIPNTAYGVRGLVASNRPDATATAQIINSATGEVTSQVIMANTEGDFH